MLGMITTALLVFCALQALYLLIGYGWSVTVLSCIGILIVLMIIEIVDEESDF